MANTMTNILDKILARGLRTLREAAVMPRLVNTDFQGEGARFGNTVDIPKSVSQSVSTVTAGKPGIAAPASKTPEFTTVALDQWKVTDFHMTDKEMQEVDKNRHFVPMQTEEAARAIANDIDVAIHNEYTGVYGYVGTAAVVPFSTVKTATDARKVLNTQLAPMHPRRVVLDPTAEAQALGLSAYSDAEKVADDLAKIEGVIGRRFGMDHFMSQNVVTHTAGTVPSDTQVGSTTAIGASVLAIVAGSALGTIVVGDVFTIAGDSQTYASKTAITTTSTNQDVTIAPTLKVIASATSVLTFKATHVVNLAFQRNAFVYVTRPMLTNKIEGAGLMGRTLTDGLSGLTMRLELIRQRKQTAWEFDVLYGTKLVRAEFATRIAG